MDKKFTDALGRKKYRKFLKNVFMLYRRLIGLWPAQEMREVCMLTPKDWTLLVISAAGGNEVQPVQLQKALFLIGKELTHKKLAVKSFYDFTAYDYGPFSSDIYTDAYRLEKENLIGIKRPPQTKFQKFLATPSGQTKATEIRSKLSADSLDYLDRVVKWVQQHSFNDIVRYIYKEYPEMKANSVFKEI